MAGGPTQQVYFDRLTGGIVRYADRLTVGPESYPHIFKDLINLIAWRGRLQRREGIDVIANPPVLPEGPVADSPILIVGFQVREETERFLMVTTRNLWITGEGIGAGWFLITPTYPYVGAPAHVLSATAGSPIVTDASGEFITRRIAPGQMILIDGDWYEIDSVDSQTQLTLTANYVGTSSPPTLSYTIRRTSQGFSTADTGTGYAAAVALNGDIYVTIRGAGVYSAALSPGVTGVVLKIARGCDGSKVSFSSADVSIVMSSDAMEPATYPLGYAFKPMGFEVLEDGRLVIASHSTDFSTYQASNRIIFSSHLDVFDWGTPGGFVDLIGARGGITGMRRMGGALAVHFQDQIQLGQITGSDTDPLAWRPTRATCGAAAPRLLMPVPATTSLPGGQIFVATTGELHLFDGDQSPMLSSSWGDLIRDISASNSYYTVINLAQYGHLSYDEHRRSVSMFGPTSLIGSHELRFDLNTGVTTRHIHHNIITAANEPRMQPAGSFSTVPYATRLIGIRGTDHAGAATDYIYAMSLLTFVDSALPKLDLTANTGPCLVDTHDLLLATPDRESRVVRVIVWYHGRDVTTETLRCYLSVDSGVSWETGVGNNSILLADDNNERRVVFYFSTSAPADRARVRILSHLDVSGLFSFALTRMMIDFVNVADVRAVA